MKKFIIVLVASLLAGCSSDQNTLTTDHSDSSEKIMVVSVGAEKIDCMGIMPMKCLIVDGSFFYDTIQGFDFERGYEYQLEIERTQPYTNRTVPADMSLYRYSLLHILSKIKVES
mgnify:CR=1 FL=1